jgi:asparagine synthase (glutamine-hydrolysing)
VGPLRRAAALVHYATTGLNGVVQYRRTNQAREAHRLFGERCASLTDESGGMDLSFRTSGRSGLDDMLQYAFNSEFVGEYLPKVDGATMHYGLEARSPFLDHRIWEFAGALPYDVRLHRGRLKAVLRELVRQEITGTVAGRRKRGFSIPVQRWIGGRWRSALETMMEHSMLEKEGWIRSGSVLERLAELPPDGVAPHQLWYVMVLESWLRHERGLVPSTRPVPCR